MKGFQLCWNKGPGSFQKGDEYKHTKIGWAYLKIFLRTTVPEKLIFTWKFPHIV
jgi:hypothetical protein